MIPPKIVIHTDVLLDYVIHRGKNPHFLRRVMELSFCYTTVFNAVELFSVARTPQEINAVENAMHAMKILGLNAKNAKRYGALLSRKVKLPRMNALIAGLCLESKLPVLTGSPKEFRGVEGLVIVRPEEYEK